MRKLIALLAAVGLAVVVSGCNTVEGMGKDVKAAGGAVEKAAEKSKTY
jgi:predicted small secreted protein